MVFNWHHRRDRHSESDLVQTAIDILETPRRRRDRHPSNNS
jgi:hypothetical protein